TINIRCLCYSDYTIRMTSGGKTKSMIVALFDSDGTLYSKQFGRGMMKYANTHGRRFPSMLYYASLVPEVLLNKMKLGNPERFQRALIERMLWLIKGYSVQQATEAFAWVIDE